MGGKCKAERLEDTVVGTTSASLDFGELLEVVQKVSKFSPCAVNPVFTWEGKSDIVRGCCNNPRGNFDGLRLSFNATAGASVSCFSGQFIPNPIPYYLRPASSNSYVGKAGITWMVSLLGKVNVSGRLVDLNSSCKDCTAKADGSITLGASATVIAEVDLGAVGLKVECSVGGDVINAGLAYDYCTRTATRNPLCFGPLTLSCTVTLDLGLGFGFSGGLTYDLLDKQCI